MCGMEMEPRRTLVTVKKSRDGGRIDGGSLPVSAVATSVAGREWDADAVTGVTGGGYHQVAEDGSKIDDWIDRIRPNQMVAEVLGSPTKKTMREELVLPVGSGVAASREASSGGLTTADLLGNGASDDGGGVGRGARTEAFLFTMLSPRPRRHRPRRSVAGAQGPTGGVGAVARRPEQHGPTRQRTGLAAADAALRTYGSAGADAAGHNARAPAAAHRPRGGRRDARPRGGREAGVAHGGVGLAWPGAAHGLRGSRGRGGAGVGAAHRLPWRSGRRTEVRPAEEDGGGGGRSDSRTALCGPAHLLDFFKRPRRSVRPAAAAPHRLKAEADAEVAGLRGHVARGDRRGDAEALRRLQIFQRYIYAY
uniref:Uncharacterized protein n=1 Tax=Setaria viridis TaxID=4556 RepID=A0A4U6VBW8_SETVI|nr:hypothetical protein SEVIR_3G222500v2 [Setaria viridis]